MSMFSYFSGAKPAETTPLIDVTSRRNFIAGSSFKHVDTILPTASITPSSEKTSAGGGDGAMSSSGDDLKDSDYSHTWMTMEASEFNLRTGPNYKRNGIKAPSGQSLYELVGVDCVQTPQRIDDIGGKVHFPEDWATATSNHPDVPAVFVVNAQIPSTFETSLFTEISDGDGWSLVHFFRIRPDVAEQLKNIETASPAVKLLAGYCKNAPEEQNSSRSPWFGRFKLILRCENIEQFGLPSFITSYNGQPVLIRNTGNIMNNKRACETHYAEMDINVHRFGSVPKKGLSMLMNRFDSMDISTAFCIESREDDEMPELVLGCARIHRPDYKRAPHWGELPLN